MYILLCCNNGSQTQYFIVSTSEVTTFSTRNRVNSGKTITKHEKDETVLQGMIDRLTELGMCYGMDMSVKK